MKIGNTEMPSRAYVGRFNFKGVDRVNALASCPAVNVVVCTAKLLQVGGNVLLLDEPTNDRISKPCARWKTPCWSSRAARWLSRTTAGSLTVLPPTFWITG